MTTEKTLTKEEQKERAIKALETLGCYKPYLNAFKRKTNPTITMYEGFGGYYIEEEHEPELIAKIREIEETYGGTVYAVIHNLTSFGECYSLLYISKYAEDQEYMFDKNYAYAYVWNKTYEECSEFGTIGVKSALGGLLRTA